MHSPYTPWRIILNFLCAINHIRRNVLEFSCMLLTTTQGMFKNNLPEFSRPNSSRHFRHIGSRTEFTEINLQLYITDKCDDNTGCTHQYDQIESSSHCNLKQTTTKNGILFSAKVKLRQR